MPAATRSDLVSANPITPTSLRESIKTAGINAGMTVFDEFDDPGAATTKVVVFQLDLSSAAKGTAYLRVAINANLQISEFLDGDWDISTHTGGVAGTQSVTLRSNNFSASGNIKLISINHAEARLILLIQALTNYYFNVGYIRPQQQLAWSEDVYHYCFLPNTNFNGFFYFRGALSPYGSTSTNSSINHRLMNTNELSDLNVITNFRDSESSPFLYALYGFSGHTGKFGDDFVQGSFANRGRYEIERDESTGQEFLILSPTACGLGVRVA